MTWQGAMISTASSDSQTREYGPSLTRLIFVTAFVWCGSVRLLAFYWLDDSPPLFVAAVTLLAILVNTFVPIWIWRARTIVGQGGITVRGFFEPIRSLGEMFRVLSLSLILT